MDTLPFASGWTKHCEGDVCRLLPGGRRFLGPCSNLEILEAAALLAGWQTPPRSRDLCRDCRRAVQARNTVTEPRQDP